MVGHQPQALGLVLQPGQHGIDLVFIANNQFLDAGHIHLCSTGGEMDLRTGLQGGQHGREVLVGDLIIDYLAAVFPANLADIMVVDQGDDTALEARLFHKLHKRLAGPRLVEHGHLHRTKAAGLQHKTAL